MKANSYSNFTTTSRIVLLLPRRLFFKMKKVIFSLCFNIGILSKPIAVFGQNIGLIFLSILHLSDTLVLNLKRKSLKPQNANVSVRSRRRVKELSTFSGRSRKALAAATLADRFVYLLFVAVVVFQNESPCVACACLNGTALQ